MSKKLFLDEINENRSEAEQAAFEIWAKANNIEVLPKNLLMIPPLPEYHSVLIERLLSTFKTEREYINEHAVSYSLETPAGRDYLGWTKAFNVFYMYLETKPETITIDITHLSPRHRDLIITHIEKHINTFGHYIRIKLDLESDTPHEDSQTLIKNLKFFGDLSKHVADFRRSNDLVTKFRIHP